MLNLKICKYKSYYWYLVGYDRDEFHGAHDQIKKIIFG